MAVEFDKKIHLTNRGDGSYAVYKGHEFLGFVSKITPRRWTCAPLGTPHTAEVTEHKKRSEAIIRLVNSQ